MAGILGLGAAATIVLWRRALLPFPAGLKVAASAFAALIIWASLSALWSIDPAQSLIRTSKILGVGACGLVLIWAALRLDVRERQAAIFGLFAGVMVLIVELVAEVLTGGFVIGMIKPTITEWPQRSMHLQGGAIILAILAWPATLAAGRRFRWLILCGILVVTCLLAVAINAWAAVAAFIAGAIVFGIALLRADRAAAAVAGLLVLGVLLAPAAPLAVRAGPWMKAIPDVIEFSAYHRLKIWSFVADRVRERPLLGWGMDASRSMPGGNRSFDINKDLGYNKDPGFVLPRYMASPTRLPLHPHNGALQWWLELGLPGALICLLLVVQGPLAIRRARLGRPATAAILGAFTATVVPASLSFGIWQTWWFSTLWLVAAILVSVARPPSDQAYAPPAACR